MELTGVNEKCFALIEDKKSGRACRALSAIGEGCGSYRCPFYKPEGCKDWIRIEDETGVHIIPPENTVGGRK